MKKFLTMAVFAFVVAMVATTSVSANTTIHFMKQLFRTDKQDICHMRLLAIILFIL